MIDVHAHAYPPAPSLLRKVSGFFPSLKPPVDIERLASFRKRGPQPAHRAAEMVLSLGLAPQVLLHGTLDDLTRSMARAGIRRTVVIGVPKMAQNRWLLDETRGQERFIPVVTLPELPKDAAESKWSEAWDELVERGAQGFKIHPNIDGLPPDHPAYRALFGVAERRKRFVILHTGCFSVLGYRDLRPADANAFSGLFAAHPTVRVCLAHMNRDRPEEAWALMERFPQLYTDTSWQPVDAVKLAIATVGVERILLGSDWPLLHGELQSDAVGVLRRAASEKEQQAIGERNALAFLGADQ